MPVPEPRDPDQARCVLTEWLDAPDRLPGAEIIRLETP
jgi:hypothetical protein